MSAARVTIHTIPVKPRATPSSQRLGGPRCTSLYVTCRAAGGASTYSSSSRNSSSGRSSGGSGRSGASAGTWPGGSFRPGGAAIPQDAAQLAKRLSELQELLREAAQIALATGPRGIARSAQAAQALLSVAREQALLLQAGQSPEQPAVVLRKLFERLGATYIKLGQFIASRCVDGHVGAGLSCWVLRRRGQPALVGRPPHVCACAPVHPSAM